MKLGLSLVNNRLIAPSGEIGEYVAESISTDIYSLRDILEAIESKESALDDPIRIQEDNYKYLEVHGDTTIAFLYNEFEEEEIEKGRIHTNDLVDIIREYLSFLTDKASETIFKLDKIYAKMDELVKSKRELIHSFTKRMDYADLRLNIGPENLDIYHLLKIYKFSFSNESISLSKNRRFMNNPPMLFELTDEGSDQLIAFLNDDIDKWYEDKMKLRYEGNKLIVEPDSDEVIDDSLA